MAASRVQGVCAAFVSSAEAPHICRRGDRPTYGAHRHAAGPASMVSAQTSWNPTCSPHSFAMLNGFAAVLGALYHGGPFWVQPFDTHTEQICSLATNSQDF